MLDLKATVVLKTSWVGIDRRFNEADMFGDCAGRFRVMPHVGSYEATGEHREVISNILFFSDKDQIAKYFWPIFSNTPPDRLDIRTYMNSMLASDGKLLTEAESPFQLSCAWADSLLGVLIVMSCF